jgi:hypothetical protein
MEVNIKHTVVVACRPATREMEAARGRIIDALIFAGEGRYLDECIRDKRARLAFPLYTFQLPIIAYRLF